MKDIPDGLFDKLINLRHLNLANNAFKRLKCSVFANLINLKILNLSQNKLQVFESKCVQSKKMFAIFIEDNQLNYLTLSGNVSEIHASGNNITKIFSKSGLDNMTVFNISKNNVENVLEIIKQLSSKLRALDVSDSPIGKLNITTFDKLDNLEHLSLRNTNLSNIQYGTFHHQKQLRSLDLSYNNLKKINFVMLHWNSGQLEMFYLDGNNLDDLNNLTKVNYPSLKFVSINENNFDCEYLSEVQQLWKNNGISVVFNPHIIPEIQNIYTHINGVTCYHNSATEENADPIGMIEILLICILVVLQCLLALIVLMKCIPLFKKNRLPLGIATEQVYNQSTVEEVSLIEMNLI